MRPTELYATIAESEFSAWISRFNNLQSLFSSRHQLHSELEKQKVDGVIEDGATIIGPVHISESSTVRAGVIIKGPVIVGPNVDVGYGAVILEGSFVSSHCEIKSRAVISGSLVMNNSRISEGCILKDCILGSGIIVYPCAAIGDGPGEQSAGTFVGDAAEIGSGAVILKGSIVRRHAKIAPLSTVSGIY